LTEASAADIATLGERHLAVVEILNDLGFVLHKEGKTSAARERFERARRLLLAVKRDNVGLDDESARGLFSDRRQHWPVMPPH